MCTVFAFDIPISQEEHVIDGQHVLTQVFEVDPDTDPASLIRNEIIQDGYRYVMASVAKEVVTASDTKDMTQEQVVTINVASESSAKIAALEEFPPYVEYEDEEGYSGKLYPDLSTLKSAETGRTPHSGVNQITKTYTFEYNDDSLVPTKVDGYNLASITWTEGPMMDESSIPSNYIATAVYTQGYSYTTINGWAFTMEYTGEVTSEYDDMVRYTITYYGTEITPEPTPTPEATPEPTPEPTQELSWWDKLWGKGETEPAPADPDSAYPDAGNETPPPTKGKSEAGLIIGIIAILIAIAAIGFGIYILVFYLLNYRVSVYAFNDETSDYQKIKDSWYRSKDASITIHLEGGIATSMYRAVLKPTLAERLKGQVVTVKAGDHILKQQIGDANGTEYSIDVTLD